MEFTYEFCKWNGRRSNLSFWIFISLLSKVAPLCYYASANSALAPRTSPRLQLSLLTFAVSIYNVWHMVWRKYTKYVFPFSIFSTKSVRKYAIDFLEPAKHLLKINWRSLIILIWQVIFIVVVSEARVPRWLFNLIVCGHTQ